MHRGGPVPRAKTFVRHGRAGHRSDVVFVLVRARGAVGRGRVVGMRRTTDVRPDHVVRARRQQRFVVVEPANDGRQRDDDDVVLHRHSRTDYVRGEILIRPPSIIVPLHAGVGSFLILTIRRLSANKWPLTPTNTLTLTSSLLSFLLATRPNRLRLIFFFTILKHVIPPPPNCLPALSCASRSFRGPDDLHTVHLITFTFPLFLLLLFSFHRVYSIADAQFPYVIAGYRFI